MLSHLMWSIFLLWIQWICWWKSPSLSSFTDLSLVKPLNTPSSNVQHWEGIHTSIIHFADRIIKYSWAHRNYQPWSQTLLLQCPQCGILDPWASVFVKQIHGYRLECKNQDCGKADGKTLKEPYSFQVMHPLDSVILSAGRKHGGCASGWLKLIIG